MATKYVPGMGIVTIPDKIDKSLPRQVLKTLAEDASQIPQEEQGYRQHYVADQSGELVTRATAIVKHELLFGHGHDVLKESDASAVKDKPGEVFDGEGTDPDDLAELSESDADDVKEKPGEVFDEGTGEPDLIDELSIVEIETGEDGEGEVKDEGDSDVGETKKVTDKSQAIVEGQTVYVVGPRQEAIVKAVHEDGSLDVTVGDQTFSVKASDIMPQGGGQTTDPKVEKHLPGKHDQRSHGGSTNDTIGIARSDNPVENFSDRSAKRLARAATNYLRARTQAGKSVGTKEDNLKDYHSMLKLAQHIENKDGVGFNRIFSAMRSRSSVLEGAVRLALFKEWKDKINWGPIFRREGSE